MIRFINYMSEESNIKNENKASGYCYPFLLFGSSSSQISMALYGLIISGVVFSNHPDTGFGFSGTLSMLPVYFGAIGLFTAGFFKARQNLKMFVNGVVVSTRLLKVEADTTPEQTEYRMFFEYLDTTGKRNSFQTVRDVNDLSVGESFSFLINDTLDTGMLEPDLPGRITFKNVYGVEPISGGKWLVVLVIPVLSLIPLIGLIGSVSMLIQQAATIVGSMLYWTTLALQIAWFAANRRYFSPGKPIKVNDNCCNQ